MPTQYTPERYTIGNVLATTNPPIRVPDWQRNYSWTSSEVEVFWRDIVSFGNRYDGENINDKEYFLGSVVIVDNNTWNLLLDGQQRLATSAILVSVIRDFLAPYNQNAATRTANKYLIDYDDATQQRIDKLTLNRYDQDFFRREILEDRTVNYVAPIPTIESHHLIRRARSYFTAQFIEVRQVLNNPHEFNNWVLRIQKILTQHVSVVAIISQDEGNAALVFETLNDRGIGLSTPDLLRNLIMRRAQENQREEIAGLWGEVLESESDVKLKTLLRHYWVSRHGDIKAQSLYREIRDFVHDQEIASLPFSRELRDASIIYRDILNGDTDDDEVNRTLQVASQLGASVLYPAFLSLLESADDLAQIRRFVRAALVTYVRHNIIGRLESSALENTLFSIARSLRENRDVNAEIDRLREFAPDNNSFQAAFRMVSIPDTSIARYILAQLELDRRATEELDVALPHRVHVEHIYPQTPQVGQRWENHTALVNRLGNLTLLSRRLNTAIKNGSFLEKKPSYEISEFALNDSLVALDEWTPARINERQEQLAERAPIIWAFPE